VFPFQRYLNSLFKIVFQNRHASAAVPEAKVVYAVSDYPVEAFGDYLFRQRVVPLTSQLSYLRPDTLHGFLGGSDQKECLSYLWILHQHDRKSKKPKLVLLCLHYFCFLRMARDLGILAIKAKPWPSVLEATFHVMILGSSLPTSYTTAPQLKY
jgi:hypothetical protein